MATFKNEDFIIDLIKQLNLNNMDDATRARLDDLKKKGLATKKQQDWKPGDPIPTITANDGTIYTYNGEPVAGGTVPVVDDLKDLYLKFVIILRDVAADKELKEDETVKKFLDDFYGPGKAVDTFAADTIDRAEANEIANYINTNIAHLALGTGIDKSKLEKLRDGLTAGTYNTNPKTLKTFSSFLSGIANWDDLGGTKPLPAGLPACIDNYSKISTINEKINTPKDPTSTQLTDFNTHLGDMLGRLVKKDKLRDKILGKDTDGDITFWINKGLNKSNYKSGDHALAPKYDDRKQFWDNAKKEVKDWYVDTLGKLEQKHTRHIYQTNARHIVAELIKKGVKPTDGTGKILETLDAIRGNLPNPVQKQLDWIKDTLTPMSKLDFFKDALRDGDQMRQLVTEIIKAAAHDDEEGKAMVALEMLAVMRYTMFTSSVRDQLKKTEFKLLSDGNLSFNKGNKFMQNLTNAFDRTLKFGMMTAFEVGNLAKNAIKQQGLRFGYGKDNLDERVTKSAEYDGGDKQKMMEKLMGFWNEVNSSSNTKDYHIFGSHKAQQKAADKDTAGTITVNLAGTPTDLEYKTEQEKRYLEYLRANNIGRAA